MKAKTMLAVAAAVALQFTVAVTPGLAVSLDAVNAVTPTKRMSADRAIDLGMTTFGAESGISKMISAGRVTPKAATDIGTIFRPVTPCRLVDTRGNGAPIQGGAFAPNTQRTILTAGNCGIPTSSVSAISLTLVTFNLTPATGGFISLVAPGAPITGTNDIFNFGSQWSGTSVNTPTNFAGSFDVFVSQATAHVIIDVNGYYQDLNELDINTQMDIVGTTAGDLLNLTQLGTVSSSTLRVDHANQGKSLTIGSGSFSVLGLGINTATTAFVHQVDTSNVFGTGTGNLCALAGSDSTLTVIDNPYTNNSPSAILMLTPIDFYNGSLATGPVHPAAATYRPFYIFSGCGAGTNKWAIRLSSGAAAFTNLNKFGILVIKP